MATNDGVIRYKLDYGVDDAKKQLGDVQGELKNTDTATDNTGKKFANFAKNAALGIAGLVIAIGGAAIAINTEMTAATNSFLAATGKSQEEAEQFEDVMNSVFANNFGDDFEDIAQSMALVTQQMGDLNDAELQKVTESAFLLRDTFEIGLEQSILGVNNLMKNFGVDSDTAFNLMAQGAQEGLNQNQDLAEQIAEYSVFFADAGFSAEEMFNIMKSGTEEGVFQVDFLNDAMKEFSIRSKDGSAAAAEAFELLGLNAEEMNAAFNQGGEVARAAFDEVQTALANLDDPIAANIAGVGLFGTKFEDLGIDAITALGKTDNSIDATTDKLAEINDIKYDDLGSAITGVKRQFEVLLGGGDIDPDALVGAVEGIILNVVDLFTTLVPTVLEAIVTMLPSLATAIIDFIPVLLDTIILTLPQLVEAGIQIIIQLIAGLTQAMPIIIQSLVDMIPMLLTTLIEQLPLLITAGIELIMSLVNGLIDALPMLIEMAATFIPLIIDIMVDMIPLLITFMPKILNAMVEALIGNLDIIIMAVIDIGIAIVEGIWTGIQGAAGAFAENVKGFFSGIVDGVKKLLKIASPSQVFKQEIGFEMASGVGVGFNDEMEAVNNKIKGSINTSFDVGGSALGARAAIASNTTNNGGIILQIINPIITDLVTADNLMDMWVNKAQAAGVLT